MSIPILKHGHYLIASVQSAVLDEELATLRKELVEQVGRFRSRGVIIDVNAVDVMDSYATRTLKEIAAMTRLRGAETVIVGIQPDVALAMVELGLTLERAATALDLEEGISYLDHYLLLRSAQRMPSAHAPLAPMGNRPSIPGRWRAGTSPSNAKRSRGRSSTGQGVTGDPDGDH